MKTFMIYGASGYTGRMATEYAKSAGLNVVAAGRDVNKVTRLANELGVQSQVFSLDDAQVERAMTGVSVILNCAGPYHRTASVLMQAAIKTGCHYLDIAAELDSYQLVQQFDTTAKSAGVLLLPGCGGSVAMLGCLAGYAAEQVPQPRKVRIAMHVAGAMSRGSAISASENMSSTTLRRRNGELEACDAAKLQAFDFGDGEVSCFPVTLPDLITIWHATRIPDIETFVHVSGTAFPEGDLLALPEGPNSAEREENRYQAAVYITDQHGSEMRMVLDTVNGYTFTPHVAIEAARRVLKGTTHSGFQTPAGLFGHEFATHIADTTITVC